MISCDNCGFGHSTIEELRACKPWSETLCVCGHNFGKHRCEYGKWIGCDDCECEGFNLPHKEQGK